MTVIRDLLDRPLPPNEVVESLKRVDDRLELKYVVFRSRDGANINLDERWAIILRWAESDKRRLMIQRGDMAPEADYDVLAYLPLDCPADQAFSYFEKGARQFHRREDVERLVSRVQKYNEKNTKDALKETKELSEELIEANAPQLFEKETGKKVTKVFLSGDKKDK